MTQGRLIEIMNTVPTGKYEIIDVRESDRIGGHIKGATNVPADQFELQIAEVQEKVKGKDYVILHCQESIKRSPRCLRLLRKFITGPCALVILEGGFDQWVRKFWKTEFVENYDDDYWGYEMDEARNAALKTAQTGRKAAFWGSATPREDFLSTFQAR